MTRPTTRYIGNSSASHTSSAKNTAASAASSSAEGSGGLSALASATKTSPLTLLRLGAWGFSAALALGIAVSVSQTDRGLERIQTAFGGSDASKSSPVDQLAMQTRVTEMETRRLYQQVQALTADRERLAQRLAALERNFDDVTGTAKTVPTARITQPVKVAEPQLPPVISAPMTMAAIPSPALPANDNKPGQPPQPPIRAAELPKIESTKIEAKTAEAKSDAKSDLKLPPKFADRIDPRSADTTVVTGAVRGAQQSQPQAAAPAQADPKQQLASKDAAPDASKDSVAEPFGKNTEFAIDLGGANSVESLKALWTATKAAHAPLLDSLTPSAVLRPTGKNGAPQLRLMAGPFANAGAAAAICQSFAAGRGNCRPFAFDGQKLPLR